MVLQYSKRSDQIILITFYPLLCVNETKKIRDEIENLVPLPKSYAQAEQEYIFYCEAIAFMELKGGELKIKITADRYVINSQIAKN